MFGIDANLNAGTAVLLIIISLIFVWGAMYAASVGVLAIWGIILLVAFVAHLAYGTGLATTFKMLSGRLQTSLVHASE